MMRAAWRTTAGTQPKWLRGGGEKGGKRRLAEWRAVRPTKVWIGSQRSRRELRFFSFFFFFFFHAVQLFRCSWSHEPLSGGSVGFIRSGSLHLCGYPNLTCHPETRSSESVLFIALNPVGCWLYKYGQCCTPSGMHDLIGIV